MSARDSRKERGVVASASETTRGQHEQVLRTLPFHDTQDFADADRGFIATITPGVITDADGRVVWDLDSYAYAGAEEAPDKVGLVSQPLSEVFQCLAR